MIALVQFSWKKFVSPEMNKTQSAGQAICHRGPTCALKILIKMSAIKRSMRSLAQQSIPALFLSQTVGLSVSFNIETRVVPLTVWSMLSNGPLIPFK